MTCGCNPSYFHTTPNDWRHISSLAPQAGLKWPAIAEVNPKSPEVDGRARNRKMRERKTEMRMGMQRPVFLSRIFLFRAFEKGIIIWIARQLGLLPEVGKPASI